MRVVAEKSEHGCEGSGIHTNGSICGWNVGISSAFYLPSSFYNPIHVIQIQYFNGGLANFSSGLNNTVFYLKVLSPVVDSRIEKWN